MKAVTLCADDFAQSPAISEAILHLLAAGRLSATSVMSESPHWPAYAAQLRAAAQGADIGLHVNLTHPFGARQRSLPMWMLLSHTRMLSRPMLRRRLLAQVDRFADAWGALPAFVDGHQHVHAFPVLRDALFDAIEARWPTGVRPWLRAPDLLADPGDAPAKAKLLVWSCRGFAGAARARGCPVPPWFAGLRTFGPAGFGGLMERWLAAAPSGAVLMCHPGYPSTEGDPIAAARSEELAWLSGPGLADACSRHAVELGPWPPSAA